MANMRKSRRLRRNKKSARRVQRRTDRNTMRQQGGDPERQYWKVTTKAGTGAITAEKLKSHTDATNLVGKKNFNDFYTEHANNIEATMALSLDMNDGEIVNKNIDLQTAVGNNNTDGVIV